MAGPLRNQRGGIFGLFGLIREYGQLVEADLASEPNPVDLRDLFRPGSGLTLRLAVLRIQMLPEGARFRQALNDDAESRTKPTVDHLRERQAHYDRMIKGGE